MRFIYFLVFGEYYCSKGVSLSDIGFTLIFSKKSSGTVCPATCNKTFCSGLRKIFL